MLRTLYFQVPRSLAHYPSPSNLPVYSFASVARVLLLGLNVQHTHTHSHTWALFQSFFLSLSRIVIQFTLANYRSNWNQLSLLYKLQTITPSAAASNTTCNQQTTSSRICELQQFEKVILRCDVSHPTKLRDDE
jgi:hypothetical protein